MTRLFTAIFTLLLLSSPSFSQARIPIDSFYQDASNLVIHSQVMEYQGIKQDELVRRVKNWGAKNFVNLKEVIVGETADQIVFTYVDKPGLVAKALGMVADYPWYIRLVIEFQDGKVRAQFFDDGNVRAQGLSARTYQVKNYFKDDKGVMLSQKAMTQGIVNMKARIMAFAGIIEKGIVSEDSLKKDW
jgi:hypothetical protein